MRSALRLLLAAVLLLPALAWAQAGDRDCLPGSLYAVPTGAPYVVSRVYLTASGFGVEGGAVLWWCWTGSDWRARGRLVHAQDVGSTLRAEFDQRIAAWSQAATQAERAALVKQWDTSADVGFCDRQIGNAGYAARLCRLVRDDQAVLAPAGAWQPAPGADPPPSPAEVWTVLPLAGATDRPTRIWPYQYTKAGTIRTAPERVPVGAPCDPTVGEGNWRGVLGRADRVGLCGN